MQTMQSRPQGIATTAGRRILGAIVICLLPGALFMALLGLVAWPVGRPVQAQAAELPEPAASQADDPLPPVITYQVDLPFVIKSPIGCPPIPGQHYAALDVQGLPTDRPAAEHADLNLALRGYEPTDTYLGLVDYGGGGDPRAPQLDGLFAESRIPQFMAVYQVYDWDWEHNCRGHLLTKYDVTLAGMGVANGETIHVPPSGYDLGQGYDVLVLYATPRRITLKYTPNDNVVSGYTLHVENVCVEPSLLALYEEWNAAGRGRLPALQAGQPLGRALGTELGVAIRDDGAFMDPRSRGDWWDERRVPY